MPDVTVNGLDRLAKAMDEIVKEAPEMQRQVHEQIGEELEGIVRKNVYDVLTRRTGKVGKWQVKHIGSGGGYAAVRAADSPAGPNGAGAVTNYLENGHAKRRNRLWSQKQSRRTRMMRAQAGGNWVRGRGFYAISRADAPRLLAKAADDLAKQIADRLR